MIVNFSRCFAWLLEHEGGFVADPLDNDGGCTNLGCTKRTYEDWIGRSVTVDEMRALTPDDVEPIYRARYWKPVQADLLPHGLDWMLFDWAVNSGPRTASKALQRLVMVRDDGVIGPNTMDAMARCETRRLIDGLHQERADFYGGLSTFHRFGKGWMRRNDETYMQALALFEGR